MINMIYENMPIEIKSFVKKGVETDTIVINSRLSYEQQVRCYLHEIQHLRNNDFEKYDIQQIEFEAHGKDM